MRRRDESESVRGECGGCGMMHRDCQLQRMLSASRSRSTPSAVIKGVGREEKFGERRGG